MSTPEGPPGRSRWPDGAAERRAAEKRIEKLYKRRMKRRGDVILDQLAWDQFRHDAGVKVTKETRVRGYVPPGAATLWGRAHPNVHQDLSEAGGYWWSLEYPIEMRREPGYWRACVICGDEIEPGQCSVHPVEPNELGHMTVGCDPDWSMAHHVRCVSVETWRAWMGMPRASVPVQTPPRPKLTPETVAEAVAEGWVTLSEGVTPEDAVARVKELRAQPKLFR